MTRSTNDGQEAQPPDYRATLLAERASAAIADFPLRAHIEDIFASVLRTTHARRGSLLISDSPDFGESQTDASRHQIGFFRVGLTTDFHPLHPDDHITPLPTSFTAHVARTRQAAILENIETAGDVTSSGGNYTSQSCLAIPLVNHDTLHGILHLTDRDDGRSFDATDSVLASLLGHSLTALLVLERWMRWMGRIDTAPVILSWAELQASARTALRQAERSHAPLACLAVRVQPILSLSSASGLVSQVADAAIISGLQQLVPSALIGRADNGAVVACLPDTNLDRSAHAGRQVHSTLTHLLNLLAPTNAASVRPLVAIGLVNSTPGARTAGLLKATLNALESSLATRISPFVGSLLTAEPSKLHAPPTIRPRLSPMPRGMTAPLVPEPDLLLQHDDSFARAVAAGLPYLAHPEEMMTAPAAHRLPIAIARRLRCIPLRLEGRTLSVAVDAPLSSDDIDLLTRVTHCAIFCLLSPKSRLDTALLHLATLQKSDGS